MWHTTERAVRWTASRDVRIACWSAVPLHPALQLAVLPLSFFAAPAYVLTERGTVSRLAGVPACLQQPSHLRSSSSTRAGAEAIAASVTGRVAALSTLLLSRYDLAGRLRFTARTAPLARVAWRSTRSEMFTGNDGCCRQ
ncbi:hypothetical protein [Streptomyces flaveolus]|uniref:hypothetical protein n=1 Tax=Streptomyces flaveolus TaxID=67297 RepID=UPI0036FDBF69